MWLRESIDGPFNFPASTGLVAQAADEVASYHFSNDRSIVSMEGTLKRSNDSNLAVGADVTLGTMPVGARPLKQLRFPCAVKLAVGWDCMTVTVRTDGLVVFYDPVGAPTVMFVDLSAISYRVR
jgi:hypothetical protein